MSTILITGGQERENGFELGEGKYYKSAKLYSLDTETGEFSKLLSIDKGNENYPEQYPNLEFTAGCVRNDELWLASDTEIFLYNYPQLELKKSFSYPFFHNIHHVQAFDEYLAVVSTGLDLVILFSYDTFEPIKFINVEGKDPWHRFSRDIDYRKVHSTRPHDGHPNYIFKLDNELWITRCTQEDAVCLTDFSKRIDISREKAISVHDGHIIGDEIFFTTVDGFLVIMDANTRKFKKEINFNSFEAPGYSKGWCRGILFENDLLYVAFSRLRPTKNKKKLEWLYNLTGKTTLAKNSSIAAYDIKHMKKVSEWKLPESSIDAIYSILPEPQSSL